MERQIEKRKRSIVSNIVLVLAVAVFLFSGYKLYTIFSEYHKGDKEYETIMDEVIIKDSSEKKEENKKRAVTLAKLLDPMKKGEEYNTEPYAMSGDVYSNPDNVGRGGWSWYTGSASWYRKLLTLIDNEKRNNCDPFS